jgi:Tol biopolymer transport system component
MNTCISLFLLMLVTMSYGCATFRFVSPTPLAGKSIGTAVLSPDGKVIVFSCGSKLDFQLYKVNIDGTGFVSLTKSPTCDFDPVFSPDGTKIAFSHISNGQGDICIVKIDGSEQTCITSDPGHDIEPIYSPDGSKIYFSHSERFGHNSPIARPAWHDWDIYSIYADGTNLRRTTSERSYGPIWNLSIDPQGDMFMASGISCTGVICMFPVNDAAKRTNINPDLKQYRKRSFFSFSKEDDSELRFDLRNPRLSPDGIHVLFTWPAFEELYIMNLKTKKVTRIWTYDSKEKCRQGRCYPDPIKPRFSHDGQKIIFSTVTKVQVNTWRHPEFFWEQFLDGVDEPKLWIINVDGTGLKSVDVK